MKRREKSFFTICVFGIMILTACGGDSGNGADSDTVAEVKTIHSLGECKGANEGVTKLVTSEDAYYTCSDGVWKTEGSSDGKSEKDGIQSSSTISIKMVDSSSSSSAEMESGLSFAESETSSSLSDSSEYKAACEGSEYDAINGTLKDCRNGKVYRTTQIGDQIWMAENLNYDTTGSYCYEGLASKCAKYGRLYQKNIAAKICPTGWHLPSKAEFEILIDKVGGRQVAGKKLKTTSGWRGGDKENYYNGTDSYSFSALPAGYVDWDGHFFYEGELTYFWGCSHHYTNNICADPIYYLSLTYYGYDVHLARGTDDNKDGYSVRCLRDEGNLSSSGKGNAELSSSSVSSSSNKGDIESSSASAPSSSSNKNSTESSSSSVSSSSSKNNTGSSSSSIDHCKGLTYNEATQICDNRDGQIYRIVTIGTGNNAQTWMAENLNYRYLGPTVDLDSSSFCYKNEPDSCTKYGRQYLWSAAMDSAGIIKGNTANGCGYGSKFSSSGNVRGVCPQGWHLPDTTEWTRLFENVGRQDQAGKVLKSKNGWSDYNGSGNGTDDFGFTALPVGFRDYTSGLYLMFGIAAYFWGVVGSYGKDLYNYSDSVHVSVYDRRYGHSVRCLKD